jgi:membrane associated rhomboid family serine protease
LRFFHEKESISKPIRPGFNLGGRWTALTALVVAANVTIFVFAYGNRASTSETSVLATSLSVDYGSIADGQIWRLLVSPFLFLGMLPLFLGSMSMYFFGGYVARRLGFGWFVFAYIACGAAGGLASSLVVPDSAYGAAAAATFGITFLCMLYFPYMYFLGGATARQLGPVLMGGVLLSGLSFDGRDLGLLSQLAALPVAYAIYRLEPLIERMRSRRRLHREIWGAFTEAEREEELDRLLQKVAREGMDGLNRKERNFLQSVSKEYRRKKIGNKS